MAKNYLSWLISGFLYLLLTVSTLLLLGSALLVYTINNPKKALYFAQLLDGNIKKLEIKNASVAWERPTVLALTLNQAKLHYNNILWEARGVRAVFGLFQAHENWLSLRLGIKNATIRELQKTRAVNNTQDWQSHLTTQPPWLDFIWSLNVDTLAIYTASKEYYRLAPFLFAHKNKTNNKNTWDLSFLLQKNTNLLHTNIQSRYQNNTQKININIKDTLLINEGSKQKNNTNVWQTITGSVVKQKEGFHTQGEWSIHKGKKTQLNAFWDAHIKPSSWHLLLQKKPIAHEAGYTKTGGAKTNKTERDKNNFIKLMYEKDTLLFTSKWKKIDFGVLGNTLSYLLKDTPLQKTQGVISDLDAFLRVKKSANNWTVQSLKLSSNLENIAYKIHQDYNIPSVSGITGQLTASKNTASFRLDSTLFTINMPGVFSQPAVFSSATASVQFMWNEATGALLTQAKEITLAHKKQTIISDFVWQFNQKKQTHALDLGVEFLNLSLTHIKQFFPYKLHPKIAQQVRQSVQGGSIPQGNLNLKLHMDKGEITKKINLVFNILDAKIQHKRLPKITQGAALVTINNQGTHIALQKALLGAVQLRDATIAIKHAPPYTLTIKGKALGTLSALRKRALKKGLLHHAYKIANHAAIKKIQGEWQAETSMRFALKGDTPPTIFWRFWGANLYADDYFGQTVAGLDIEAKYTDTQGLNLAINKALVNNRAVAIKKNTNGFSFHNLHLNIDRKNKTSTMQGSVHLFGTLERTKTNQLKINTSVDWRALFLKTQDITKPLKKTWPTVIDFSLDNNTGHWYVGGRLGSFAFHTQQQKTKRTCFSLNTPATCTPDKLRDQKNSLVGVANIEKLYLPDWLDLIAYFNQEIKDSSSKNNKAEATKKPLAVKTLAVQVAVKELILSANLAPTNMALSIQNDEGSYLVTIASSAVTGVVYADNSLTHYTATLDKLLLDFSKTDSTDKNDKKETNQNDHALDPWRALSPKRFPNIRITTKKLVLGQESVGNASLLIFPAKTNQNALILKFNSHGSGLHLSAHGLWEKTNKDKTKIQINGDIKNFHHQSGTNIESGFFRSDMEWNASPAGYNKKHVRATADLEVTNALSNSDALNNIKGLRFLGLFNILEIRDLLNLTKIEEKNTILFKKIQAKIAIEQGKIYYKEPLFVDSIGFYVKSTGSVDVISGDVDVKGNSETKNRSNH